MKVLMLVNWKVKYTLDIPKDIQSPDYYTQNEKYWFFKYFKEDIDVDVIDISSNRIIELFEKKVLHFYIVQAFRAIKKMKKYDLIISHGMPSGILLALYRRIFGKKDKKHIIFDIGAFNSAKETGKILKLNQFASKSIDGIIYHESEQIEYYKKCFPWLVKKAKFIPFGTDIDYFEQDKNDSQIDKYKDNYILSIGYNFRDNDTLIAAYKKANINYKLKIIGSVKEYKEEDNIQYYPPIDKRTLNSQIQCARFCVLPLEYKNFSFGQMTLLQQMYYSKAVITANVPSVKDYVQDGKTAVLYKSQDIEDLKNKIELLKDEQKAKTIGEEAKKIVIDEFNERNMALEIEKFIKNIIEGEIK